MRVESGEGEEEKLDPGRRTIELSAVAVESCIMARPVGTYCSDICEQGVKVRGKIVN